MNNLNKNKTLTFLKLFILFLTIGYTAMPEQSSAADIVVRAVKIKKKNPKSNDCHCDLPSSAFKNLDIDSMTITATTTTTFVKGGGTETKTELSFAFIVEIKNNDAVKTAALDFNLIDANGKTVAVSLTPTYNKKTGQYEGGPWISLDGIRFPSFSGTITLTNTKGDSVFFEAISPKEKNKDSCATNFKLKEVTYQTATVSGIYTMQFTFAFEANSDAPTTVEMIVQLTNCKGTTQNIKVKLYYDANTGTYMGGQSIAQDKGCTWALTYGEIYATNPCGDESTWAVDFGQSKWTHGTVSGGTGSAGENHRSTLK